MIRKPLKSLIARFIGEEKASVTVEFVIFFPVLMFWWIGSVVFFDAFQKKASAARVTHVIADIISRQTETSDAFITSMSLLKNRMIPNQPGGSIRISSIEKLADGSYDILWTRSSNGDPLTVADIPLTQVPTLSTGQTILFVESYIPFTPISNKLGIVARVWTNRVFINPRYVSSLPLI